MRRLRIAVVTAILVLCLSVLSAPTMAASVISFDALQLAAGAGKVQYELAIGDTMGWATELYIRAENLGKSWVAVGIETGPRFYKEANLEGFWWGVSAGIRCQSDQSPVVSAGIGTGYKWHIASNVVVEPAAWFTLRNRGVTGFFPKLGIGYRF